MKLIPLYKYMKDVINERDLLHLNDIYLRQFTTF